MSNKQKLILRVYAHGNPEIIEHSEEIETFLFDLNEWIEAQSNGYDLLTRREQESIKALLKGALVFFYVEDRIDG